MKRISRILPSRLRKNDLIGLVTPGSAIKDAQLDETVRKLEGLGYRVLYQDSVLDEYGFLAGKDADRAAELMLMFANKEVDAILCVRGGYGAVRLLGLLDYGLIRKNPKLLLGYSDITALHAAIYKKTGLVGFYSPMGVSDFNSFSMDSFNHLVAEPTDTYKYVYKREENTIRNPEFDIYTLNPGVAEGDLAGGNISVLESLTGTEYEPDFKDKIVYLEEVDEKTYKVDKMLFHLLSATKLKQAAAIVMGVFKNCNINEEPSLGLRQALHDLLSRYDMPVSYGLPFGHINYKISIPFGIKARLNANENSLELLEKAVL